MKILVVGSGGREHALAWKLAQSPRVEAVFVAPGNPGCAEVATCVNLDPAHLPALVRWAREERIDLVVPGPEAVLCAGIVDACREAGIPAFGPSRAAAELERSKVFAKNLMRRHGIPTADYAVFEQSRAALRYLDTLEEGPLVVKADGLAAGKGVTVCETTDEAREAVRLAMEEEAFGEAGSRVVIEECLRGQEVSILALTDGKTIAPLASAQDHKPVFDNDLGPNTGGMGAVSPTPLMTPKLLDEVVSRILVPTVHAMGAERRRYRGVLYAGLMITSGGPRVLEFNVRFGDPETQPILMRLDSDLVDLLEGVATGTLAEADLRWREEAAVCVVMASGGYPGPYETGVPIEGLEAVRSREGVEVFHAGTSRRQGATLTAGGRVLGVTALGADVSAAREAAYDAVGGIRFEGAHYRTDIGAKVLARQSST